MSSFSLHKGGGRGVGGDNFQKLLSARLDWKEIFKAKLCTKTCYILSKQCCGQLIQRRNFCKIIAGYCHYLWIHREGAVNTWTYIMGGGSIYCR